MTECASARGIGLAIAVKYVQRNADVTILSRSEEKLAKAAAELEQVGFFLLPLSLFFLLSLRPSHMLCVSLQHRTSAQQRFHSIACDVTDDDSVSLSLSFFFCACVRAFCLFVPA